jgi:hypothetical protein
LGISTRKQNDISAGTKRIILFQFYYYFFDYNNSNNKNITDIKKKYVSEGVVVVVAVYDEILDRETIKKKQIKYEIFFFILLPAFSKTSIYMRAISPSPQQAQPDATRLELCEHWQPAALEQQEHLDDFLLKPVAVQPQPVTPSAAAAEQAALFSSLGAAGLVEQHDAVADVLGAAAAFLLEQHEAGASRVVIAATQGSADSRAA